MIIISMLLAMGLFLTVLLGILLFVIGLILGIIGLVNKKKSKKAFIILGILSLIFMIGGLIVGIAPVVVVKGAGTIKDAAYNNEIKDFDDDEIAKVDSSINLDEGFEYKGIHHNQCPDEILVPSGEKEAVGAIVYDNGKHTLLYELECDYGDDIICTENTVYCPKTEYTEFMDYYRNKAKLDGKISYYEDKKYIDLSSDKIDSDKIREIRDYIKENGSKDHSDIDEQFDGAAEAHADFYSTDDVYWLSMSFQIKDEAVAGTYDKLHVILPKEYADYIIEIAEE